MKNLFAATLLVLGLFSLSSNAQEGSTSLDDQFTKVLETSNRYKSHKVIKIELLDAFQKSMRDTIAIWKTTLNEKRTTIASLEARIDSLEANTSKLTEDLAIARKKENGMEVFGAIIAKSLYQIIVWTIIGFLILLVFILFFRYRSSNAITKEANAKLAETEAEFESHRQRSLEREQQLRRKLQDEINKQKE